MIIAQKNKKFLLNLLKAPSPSGFEKAASDVVQAYGRRFADVRTDTMGNTFVALGAEKEQVVMLDGHIDQLGLQIHTINKEGYCWFNLVGGYDPNTLVSQHVVIHTKDGPVPGVLGGKAIHLQTPEEKKEGC